MYFSVFLVKLSVIYSLNYSDKTKTKSATKSLKKISIGKGSHSPSTCDSEAQGSAVTDQVVSRALVTSVIDRK